MKKCLMVLLTVMSMIITVAQVAVAGVVVEDLRVRRQGADVNIRVTVHNDTAQRVNGPSITLYVRKDEAAQWTRIKTWTDISMIQPHYKVSRDFFEENNALLRDLAASGSFQAKASVQASGLKEMSEKVSTWKAGDDQ